MEDTAVVETVVTVVMVVLATLAVGKAVDPMETGEIRHMTL